MVTWIVTIMWSLKMMNGNKTYRRSLPPLRTCWSNRSWSSRCTRGSLKDGKCCSFIKCTWQECIFGVIIRKHKLTRGPGGPCRPWGPLLPDRPCARCRENRHLYRSFLFTVNIKIDLKATQHLLIDNTSHRPELQMYYIFIFIAAGKRSCSFGTWLHNSSATDRGILGELELSTNWEKNGSVCFPNSARCPFITDSRLTGLFFSLCEVRPTQSNTTAQILNTAEDTSPQVFEWTSLRGSAYVFWLAYDVEADLVRQRWLGTFPAVFLFRRQLQYQGDIHRSKWKQSLQQHFVHSSRSNKSRS